MKKPQPLVRLEQMFRMWKDGNFRAWVLGKIHEDRANRVDKEVASATDFRLRMSKNLEVSKHRSRANEILGGSTLNWKGPHKELFCKEPLPANKYHSSPMVVDLALGSSPILMIAPELLHKWCQNQRRVYDVATALQQKLESTSIGSVHWGDFRVPFKTFCVSLSIPMPWSMNGDHGEIDLLWVNMTTEGLHIVALGKEMDLRTYVTEKKKQHIIEALDRGHYGEAAKAVVDLPSSYFVYPTMQMMTLPFKPESPVMKDLTELDFLVSIVGLSTTQTKGKLPDFWQLLVRMVVGLCLHLELAKRAHEGEERIIQSEWEEVQFPQESHDAIVNGALCSLVDVATPLSLDEVAFHKRIREAGIEIATREFHSRFIAPYWRRKPGTGHIPDAPRTVEVSAYTWGKRYPAKPSVPDGSTASSAQTAA